MSRHLIRSLLTGLVIAATTAIAGPAATAPSANDDALVCEP